MKLKIELVSTDSLDEKNYYYLYEVISDCFHYYVARSQEDELELGENDYSNEYAMLDRADFTDKEWEIAKYLFHFLWDSDNGTNTCVDQDIYEEDGFTRKEMEKFMHKFVFDQAGVLDLYSDGGVEIYWDYFSCFNLMTCNFWEDFNQQ